MNRWLFALILGAFASLTAARFISAPAWVDFLWASFAFGALAFGVLVGIIVRAKAPQTWRSYT
ncbi:MAG: hypothetical protein KAI47_13275, partial [Deltaproteobacteria bacterium]|nr:hypothetical protein [Deltaproteobacteria bacterium]